MTQSNQRKEYLSRINNVIDYIENNISSRFSLDELASVANFSKFHFHRIFASVIGETLNSYILRIRLEKAASLLLHNPNKPVTDIWLDCGFSSSSVFARAFKDNFGMSASEWRKNKCAEFSNIDQHNSNESEVSARLSEYFGDLLLTKKGVAKMNEIKEMIEPKEVKVEEREEFTVAYIRYIGPYKGNSDLFEGLFTRLFKWAMPNNLCVFPQTKILSIYHDNPDITDEDKLRTSVCISVPEDTEVSGEVGKMKVAGGKYAIASFELAGAPDYAKAWKYVFAEWLPSSGYEPDNNPTFEMYLNHPEEHPEKKHIVDIYVPVKPL